MRKSIVFAIALASVVNAETGFYGLDGIGYTPRALQESDSSQMGFSMDHLARHASGHVRFAERWTVGLSTTWRSVGDSGFKQKAEFLIPSIRYQLVQQKKGNTELGYSVGYLMPYGAFVNAGWKSAWPLATPSVSGGLALPFYPRFLGQIYAFGNAELRFATPSRQVLPFGVFAEGAWSPSSAMPGEIEESFYSLGCKLYLGRNAEIQALWRVDPVIYGKLDLENRVNNGPRPLQNNDVKNGHFMLRLDMRFDTPKWGVKGNQQ